MSSPQPEIKVHQEFRFNICSVLLEKPGFKCVFVHPIMLLLSNKKRYGSCLCDMQINLEMVSNAHVRQLTVSL